MFKMTITSQIFTAQRSTQPEVFQHKPVVLKCCFKVRLKLMLALKLYESVSLFVYTPRTSCTFKTINSFGASLLRFSHC